MLVASCGADLLPVGPATPQEHELANIRPGHVIPKTAPATLTDSFDRFCVRGMDDFAAIPAALVAADYVQTLPRRGSRAQSFVVDDKRPLVMLTDTGAMRACAVSAESRTGQTTRAQAYVATRFPGARPVEAERIGPRVEQAWLVGRAPDTFVFTSRDRATAMPATLTLAIAQMRDTR
jgi:hypothetical protein